MRIFKSEQWLMFFNMLFSKVVNFNKKPDSFFFKTILVIKLDEIGDMATSTHVFSLLKKAHPDSEITVLCKTYCVELIKNHPDVDEIITDFKLWNAKFDLVVHLRGTFKTLFKSIQFWPKYNLDRGSVRFANKNSGQKHETITNFEIIKPVLKGNEFERPKIFISEENKNKARHFLEQNSINKFALLHTGARKVLRQWSPQNFALLANWLYKEFEMQIVFSGGIEDVQNIEQIQQLVPFQTYSFTGEYSILDFAALSAKANLFVGNESGPLQIANCFNIPLIGLFGPGVKEVFYPLGNNAATIHHVLECNPCDQLNCVRSDNPCINLITLNEVQIAIKNKVI